MNGNVLKFLIFLSVTFGMAVTTRPGRDFHALRHSFTTGLEEAGVSRQFIDELTGHEGAGETSRYAKGASLKVLNEAVARLDYGLDLSHLYL
jgi:integrase